MTGSEKILCAVEITETCKILALAAAEQQQT